MKHVISVISPGNMGAGIGARLVERGAEVRTWLDGRGSGSAERARAAGMAPTDPDGVAAVDFVLSIVPPGSALALAERLAPTLARADRKPVYVDCNAVSPATVRRIADVVAATGCDFLDGGIIGGPPRPSGKAPALYVSGPRARSALLLSDYGLDIRLLDGPIGAASALKMSYAGITKGFTALGAAMALAATEAGAAEALHRELADSQPALLAWLTRQMPQMYSKAYRWVAEMEEISAFIGEPEVGGTILAGAARLYERIAEDEAGDHRRTAALDRFFTS